MHIFMQITDYDIYLDALAILHTFLYIIGILLVLLVSCWLGVLLPCILLHSIGFRPEGVVYRSHAAKFQKSLHGVKKGSAFATLQRIGSKGLAPRTQCFFGMLGAATGWLILYWTGFV